jgi:RNA polymerase sigma-70 factor, ECF subfamily
VNDDEFRRVFADHAPAVFGYAVRRVGPDLAEDVLADVFLTAWRRRSELPPDRERAWLLVTARWVISDARRSATRRERLLRAVPVPSDEPDPAGRVSTGVDVRRALATLRPLDQEVLRLAEWDQLGHAEAAAVLGCSTATFTVRLRRARARFARALAGDAPAPDRARPRSLPTTATEVTP